MARTWSVCSPAVRPWSSCGEEQLENSAPSRAHSKSSWAAGVPLSVPLNSNTGGSALGLASGPAALGFAGFLVISVVGAELSRIIHSQTAGSDSTSRFGLVACTSKVCATPGCSPVYSFGELQKVGAAPSSEHWNLASGSSDSKVNVADVLSVVASGSEAGVGPERIVATGAVRCPLSQV